MNFRPNLLKPAGPNSLAQEADFEIGALLVSPSRLEIRAGEKREKTQPRVMQVLVTMAGARGVVVSRDELIGRCWSGRIVGEDSISRCVAKVRELANLANPPAFEIETIPRVGYRLKPAAATATARSPATAGNIVLAVLAFDNLSNDADLKFFSEGVSEEILQTMARAAQLKVIGRGSSFQFRGADKAASHIASVLKATHILDGSVRRSQNRVRISASLIECAGETTLWSHRFDRELSDVFALQDEISSAVAAALKVALFSMPQQREVIDPAAYDLYLKALELRHEGLQEDTRLAVIRLLEKSTELAPDFAGAWAFLATMQASQLRFDAIEGPVVLTRAQVARAAETALRLDPGLGGAYQALGYLKPLACFEERGALHQTALAVSPNDLTVLTNVSLFFAETGRLEIALRYARHAYEIDPMNPWAANWYASTLDYTGRLAEGRVLWDGFLKLWPDNRLIMENCIGEATARRDWAWFDELVAVAAARRFDNPGLRRTINYGNSLRECGPDDRARELQRLRETLRTTGTLRNSSYMLLSRLGLIDEAFELIRQASFAYVSDPEAPTPNGRTDDGLIFAVSHNTVMMRDVRFVGFCDRLGLCDYWVKTGNWPDCAEAVAPYYDFRAEARRLVAA